MDEELLKKLAGAFGVDPKNLPQGTLENVSKLLPSSGNGAQSPRVSSSNPIRDGLTRPPTDPYLQNQQKQAAVEESIAAQMANTPDIFVKDNKTATRKNNELQAGIRKSEYAKAGLEDPLADKYAPFLKDGQGNNRLDAFKASQKAPQAEAARRQGIRDEAALPISDNIEKGLTGRDIFQDRNGQIEGPVQIKDRLIKEGADRGDAEIAAGQRYRDMFEAPNAKSNNGAPNAQRNAVMGTAKGLREDGTSPRMDVMAALKTARSDNLKALTEQRMADPNRKPVGTEMAITSGQTGEVLMKRGEGEARVARGGLQGAVGGTEDVLGKMELTPAGENAIRDRLTVNKTADGATAVTGRYGTGVSGPKSTVDQMKERGLIAKDFQLTSEQKTGQAPLPKEFADARTKMLADAGQTAKRDGAVVGDAKPLMDRVSAGTVNNIDKRADRVAADLKQSREDKLGSDFLKAYKDSGGKVSSASDPNKTLFTANGMKVNAADVAANNRALPKELGGQGMNLRDAAKPTSLGPRTDQEKTAMQGFLNSNDELKRKLARR
jgi:hypothetical protein